MGHNYITEKQELFCQYRADGRNKTDAYRLAGYKIQDGSSVWNEAHKMETNPKVIRRIEEIKRERAEASKPERILAESVQLDILQSKSEWFWKLDEENGAWRLRKPYELSQRAWNCIKRVTKNGYEFHSKLEAIKVLAGMCGWNSIQVNQQSDNLLKFDTLYFGLPDKMTEDAEDATAEEE